MVEDTSPMQVATDIGREYVEADSLPGEGEPITADVYQDLALKVAWLFDRIPVPVTFQPEDPYDGYADMARTVGEERRLRVYNQHTDHPHLTHQQQLKFRAVHDWHGHLSADVDFSPAGEYRKYLHMRRYFNFQENRAVFGEVVGQAGAVHYLPDGFADDRYEQRAFLAPERWLSRMKRAVL